MARKTNEEDPAVARRVGAAIRDARQAHPKYSTIERLAEKAGISPDFLRKVERGLHAPNLGAFLRIAGALDVTPSTLLRAAGLDGAAAGDEGDPVIAKIAGTLAGRHPKAREFALKVVELVGAEFPARLPGKRPQ